MHPSDVLTHIQNLVRNNAYRVRLHAVRHMIEEGFDEIQLKEALNGKLRMLESYNDEKRYLVLGYFLFSTEMQSPLHIVCDLSKSEWVDIVTAYIPQKPWWITPTKRGRTL